MSAPRVLVVDDEASIRFVLERALGQEGFEVVCAAGLAEARRSLEAERFAVILCDVRLPDGSGLDLVSEVAATSRPPKVVVMTARESMEVAVEAMKRGARDFVVKPFDLDRLAVLLRELTRGPAAAPGAASPMPETPPRTRLLGSAPKMLEVFKAIGRVAPSDVTVLVTGESGTGKELVARAIHDNSPRAAEPFITVNCAAIPPDLMESELFGHERGSFTGAVESRKGKFELADRGTLFLDEVGELPLPLQAKLLRVLQERVIERVGGVRPLRVDVRIVAATHRDLARMVREGSFREDLYYRLNVVPILLPPLRERPGDVGLLARALVAKWGPELARQPVELGRDAIDLLESYAWPGNVRELENVLKRALLFCRGGVLTAAEIREATFPGSPVAEVSEPVRPAAAPPAAAEGMPPAASPSLEEQVAAEVRRLLARPQGGAGGIHAALMRPVERALLAAVLEHAGGNQLKAARVLGMNRNTLRRRIRELQVPVPAKRRNRRRS
ncbi:MAG: sigma-54-dependent Fis family transcriptional regulator [Deltaproteobacteria bacterium]|nr:MAG: sigma-54-dependent Fis family transcriptional regulator [Deltaproteobacteria bacterium]